MDSAAHMYVQTLGFETTICRDIIIIKQKVLFLVKLWIPWQITTNSKVIQQISDDQNFAFICVNAITFSRLEIKFVLHAYLRMIDKKLDSFN
jgi:hypothetical protein